MKTVTKLDSWFDFLPLFWLRLAQPPCTLTLFKMVIHFIHCKLQTAWTGMSWQFEWKTIFGHHPPRRCIGSSGSVRLALLYSAPASTANKTDLDTEDVVEKTPQIWKLYPVGQCTWGERIGAFA